ncbi:hypothetical protein [Nonomuraea sp. NPDC048916]|uniref:hypothetical protein n=1 Tax=Nonomuraea sp. NPDC048916 TaxID=3154232 RepID=UPI003407D001
MSGQRHRREPGTLPRPLAVLVALTLAGATGAAISLLPADAAPRPSPAPPEALAQATPATPATPPVPQAGHDGPSGFVRFVDTAREPGLDLPADARRTGLRWYALGHLVAGAEECTPAWSGRLDPAADPIGRLRAAGADATVVFGGPGGRELAATCVRPGGLASAYREVVGALGVRAIDFEVRDGADRATVLRRARAVHALQRESALRAGFTLPLRPYGLAARDLAMLRLTREQGVRVGTINLLVTIEPQDAPEGRMPRVAAAVRAAQGQIARALGPARQESPGVALTSVLAGDGDLSETDARKLAAFAVRQELAWLSLRGVDPGSGVTRTLWRTSG